MTEILESIKPPEVEAKEPPPPEKVPVTIRAIMLFDGTMNNKTNIASREANNEAYRKATPFLNKLKYGIASTFNKNAEKPKGATSYENGRTNIVTLDTNTAGESAKGYTITIQDYTEGAGTINNASDATVGYAIGKGRAGVKAKCKAGIDKIVTAIQNSKVDNEKLHADKHIIKLLTIDLFGFSRGAATARYAVHQLLFDEQSIEHRLKLLGFDVQKVEVCFVGVFDTVSSHGVNFEDDTEALHLNAIKDKGKVKHVLHLAAADEHRKNFSLTNVQDSEREEFYMPGAHSDVGGSYHDYPNIDVDDPDYRKTKGNGEEHFYLNTGSVNSIKKDMQNLIDDNWYQPHEIEYEEFYNEMGVAVSARIKANRIGIRNAYCNIPLKFMAKKAKEFGVPINEKLETDAQDLIDICDCKDLKDLDANIGKYMVTDIKDYPWRDALLLKIRNRHLHMSSKDEIGLKPRFKQSDSKGRPGHMRGRDYYGG